MKVVVIGCTHAGTAAINNIASRYPDASITVYERNDNISFLSCGIALYVGGVVKDPQGLFYSSPEKLASMGVTTRMRHDVTDVDTDGKTLTVRNLDTGEAFTDNYDRLVITTGSWPIVPGIPGMDLGNVLLSKNYGHANDIIAASPRARHITVVGAGYIGVELAEAFRESGKAVTLVDSADRIMAAYLDPGFTAPVEEVLEANGIRLMTGTLVTELTGADGKVTGVRTTAGDFDTDMVVMCVGFKPNTGLFRGKLDMLPNGAIVTDEYMRTSRADVFAAGDCCAVRFNPTGDDRYIALATNAVRMGTLVAMNLGGPRVRHRGTQGTSGIRVYGNNIAATGLTLEGALREGLKAAAVTVEDNYRPEFMPTHEMVTLRVVYEEDGGRILGAQILSKADVTQMMNTVSVCIQSGMTMEDLAFVDFFFQPHFNKPWGILNTAGLKSLK